MILRLTINDYNILYSILSVLTPSGYSIFNDHWFFCPSLYCDYIIPYFLEVVKRFFEKIWDSAICTKNKWVFSDIVYILTFSTASFGGWYGISLKTPFIHLYIDYTLILYIYSHVRRVFPDLYNDQNVQTAQKPSECRTRRGKDQTTIYIPGGFIHAYTAFWRVG